MTGFEAAPASAAQRSAPYKVVVVAGVTASGKTQAAVRLAQALGGEVVSADSVQVYRGFDIGSAKPTLAEREGVPHHVLDCLDPDQPVDAVAYARLADRAIADIVGRGRVPIVAGGTGLWLRALLRGLVDLPKVDPTLRARLDADYDRLGAAAMHQRLRAVDPELAASIHAHNRPRVVRGLEVYEQTGRALSAHWAAHRLGAPRYDAWVAVLDPSDRDALYAGIDRRIRAMVDAGWVGEVEGLLRRFGPAVRPMQSVGYAQMKAHALGEASLNEAIAGAQKATRVYARRQRTWFRAEVLPRKWWTDGEGLLSEPGLARVQAFLKGARAPRGTT